MVTAATDKERNVLFHLPPTLWRAAKAQAAWTGITFEAWLQDAVARKLAQDTEGQGDSRREAVTTV